MKRRKTVDGQSSIKNAVYSNGRLYTTHEDSKIRVWNNFQGSRVWGYVFGKHTDGIYGLDVDGDILVSGGNDNKVILWNITTGEIIAKLSDHTNNVYAVKIKNNVLVTAGKDNTAIIYRLENGNVTLQHRLTGHSELIFRCDFNSTHLITASYDDTLRVRLISEMFNAIFTDLEP